MVDLETRKRGAQPGNHNAARYGLYYNTLSPDERKAYLQVRKSKTLDHEIAIVRNMIPQIAADPKSVDLLPRVLSTLDRLIRTNETLKPRRSRRRAPLVTAPVQTHH